MTPRAAATAPTRSWPLWCSQTRPLSVSARPRVETSWPRCASCFACGDELDCRRSRVETCVHAGAGTHRRRHARGCVCPIPAAQPSAPRLLLWCLQHLGSWLAPGVPGSAVSARARRARFPRTGGLASGDQRGTCRTETRSPANAQAARVVDWEPAQGSGGRFSCQRSLQRDEQVGGVIAPHQ